MKLQTQRPDPGSEVRHVVRSSWVPPLLASLVSFAVVAAGAVALWRLEGLPWLFWLFLGPMALVGGPLLLLIAFSFFGVFRSALRETNWLACVRRDGMFLNLRSYRNGHFEGEDPTVVFVPFDEVATVRRVVEARTAPKHDGVTQIRVPSIDLTLKGGVSTEELEIACFLERTREAPATERMGIRSRTKHHDVPVFVPEPGCVRVGWDRGLFEALAREVKAAPELLVDLDQELKEMEVEARANELLRRGQRMGAVQVLREAGWEHDDAKAWIESERSRAA